MKKILFRADAHSSVGTGDLVSLIHLSKYFENDGWIVQFLCRDHPTARRIIESSKIKNAVFMHQHTVLKEEVVLINSLTDELDIEVLMFEITDRKLSEYTGLPQDVVKACVNFDGSIPYDFDLVINWEPRARELFDCTAYPNTRFLLGPEYVILPVEFDLSAIRKRKFKNVPETLLITMGGADELNLTQQVVNVLINRAVPLVLTVIIGSGYRFEKELRDSLQKSQLRFEIKSNVVNMFLEYMRSDVAIASGGLTVYELIATKTPAVVISSCEHQVERCKYFAGQGLITYLGYRELGGETLIENILHPAKNSVTIEFNPFAIKDTIDEMQ